MYLTEQHLIKKSHKFFKELDEISFRSKNLYNQALFRVRQYYFENKNYLTFENISKTLAQESQADFRNLPAKVSQQTLKLVDQNFKSFFGGLKSKKVKKARIPKYLDKVKGRQVVTYTVQALSKPLLKQGFIKLSGTNITFKTKVDPTKIKQVRIVPHGNHYTLEVVYEVSTQELLTNNNRYCAIDLGINNLATIGSNCIKPFIINGRPLKSINQYFNKEKAKLQSQLIKEQKTYTSKKLQTISLIRKNKINDYLHKASRYIINHLVSNNINTLIIGYNPEWKQEINIGKVNNQKFVNIPHQRFIQMLTYKAELVGINVILNEESYTSKTSFLDNEPVQKREKYLGKRIKRGLFRSSQGFLINADLNGALNILRKVVGEFQYPIEVCSTPLVVTL